MLLLIPKTYLKSLVKIRTVTIKSYFMWGSSVGCADSFLGLTSNPISYVSLSLG